MTGPEQLAVNELGHLVRGMAEAQESYRTEQRAATAEILARLRALEDDKIARDAVAASKRGSVNVSWRAIGAAFTLGLAFAGLAMRALGY